MKRSNRLILLIGVFLAALAFVFVVVLLGGGTPPPGSSGGPTAPPTELDTVVAARDIPLGVTVTAAMVTTEKILVTDREGGALGAVSQAIGKVARTTITRGQQVTAAAFGDTGQIESIEVPAGFTAIAVQVDQLTGVGTLIRKGDYVDVIAQISPTFPVLDEETAIRVADENYDHTSVKVLMQGVQVVGTLLPPPPATTDTGVATPAPEGPVTGLTGQQEIVIIAVTTQQAEVIKFALVDGNITLALRSPRDFVDDQGNVIIPPVVETTGLVLANMITDHGVLVPQQVTAPQPTAQP